MRRCDPPRPPRCRPARLRHRDRQHEHRGAATRRGRRAAARGDGRVTEIVREGYDAIADTFEAWRDRIADDPRDEWRNELVARLPDGARILELGCGAGHDARALAKRFELTGVDGSAEQLGR